MLQGIRQKTLKYIINSNTPKMLPLASASEKKYPTLDLQTDKRYNYKHNGYTGAQASSIERRNARERSRVKQVNDGFNALKKKLPASVIAALSGAARRGSGKKLSKVDILKMVVEYIKYLQSLIDENDATLRTTNSNTSYESLECVNKDVFCETSPYSESVSSPAGSECYDDISSAYLTEYIPNNFHLQNEQLNPMDENDLIDVISTWQQK